MKPSLNIALILPMLAFGAGPLAQADYNAGQLLNEGQTYTGEITISHSTNDGVPTGAIQISGDEGEGTVTVLEGNIHLIAGQDAQPGDGNSKNHGVVIAKDPTIVHNDDYIPAPSYVASVTLKTTGADDRIVIDTYGNQSAGVWIFERNSSIVLDASSSNHAIEINMLNSSVDSGMITRGISADLGSVEVIGDLNVNIAVNGASTGLTSYAGTLTVRGNTTVTSTGTGSRGLRTAGGNVTLYGDYTANIQGHGIHSYRLDNEVNGISSAGSITVEGNATIYSNSTDNAANYGLFSTGVDNQLTMKGATEINMKGAASVGVRATESGMISTKDVTVSSEWHGVNLSTSGRVNVDGDLSVDASGGTGYGIMQAGGSTMQVAGAASLKTDTAMVNKHAVSVTDGSSLTIGGKTTINAGGFGLNTETGGTVILNSSVDITATSTAVRASGTGSTITLNGAENISTTGAYVLWAANGGEIKGNAGYYRINGVIASGGTNTTISLAMIDNSVFTGSVTYPVAETQVIDISLGLGSTWNVTANSVLTTLDVDGSSMLNFSMTGGSFTNINAASISLASGTVLMLGADLSYFQTQLMSRAASVDVALFAGTSFTDDGAMLVTSDNYVLEYTADGSGNYSITGITDVQIPEPATATLGLLGLASLMLRRRRA